MKKLAKNILQKARVIALVSEKNRTTQADELTAIRAINNKIKLFLFFISGNFSAMKLHKFIAVFFVSFLFAQSSQPNSKTIQFLIGDEQIQKIYSSETIKSIFKNSQQKDVEKILLKFKNKPEKTRTLQEYSKIFITDKRINRALVFYVSNKNLFREVYLQTKVDPFLVLSIISMETNFGEAQGEFRLIDSFFTQIEYIPERKEWAEKQLKQFLIYCFNEKIAPESVKGSYAGAFGYGQFIPTSFESLFIDFNLDGKKDPYGWEDTIGSISNYLFQNQYPVDNNNFSINSEIWKSVRTYNRSDNYASTAIYLRNEILKEFYLLD